MLDDADEPAFIRTVALDITALKEAEAERGRSLSLLQATLDATSDAILVADLEDQVTASNRAFAELWQIPQHVLESADRDAIVHVSDRVADPDEFLRRLDEITGQDREIATHDFFELADGRTIERHTVPQRLGARSSGASGPSATSPRSSPRKGR